MKTSFSKENIDAALREIDNPVAVVRDYYLLPAELYEKLGRPQNGRELYQRMIKKLLEGGGGDVE